MLVKAGFGFFDIAAKVNRAAGEVFEVGATRGKTLVDLGMCAEVAEPKKPTAKSAKKSSKK